MDSFEKRRSLAFFDVTAEVFSVVGCNPFFFLGLAFFWSLFGTGLELALPSLLPGGAGRAVQWFASIIMGAFFDGALILAALSYSLGEKRDPGLFISEAVRKMKHTVPLSFLFTIILTLGFFLLIFPGVYLLVRWGLWWPLVLTDKDGGKPFKSSEELVEGAGFEVGLLKLAPLVLMLLLFVPAMLGRTQDPPGLFSLETWLRLTIGPLVTLWGSVMVAVIYKRLTRSASGALPV